MNRNNGTQYILWWNVRLFGISKNKCAHRFQHSRLSLGPILCSFLSMIFRDFWVWKLKSRVVCTARYMHSLSANLVTLFLYESLNPNLCVVVCSASFNIKINRKWRHQKLFEFQKIFIILKISNHDNFVIRRSSVKIGQSYDRICCEKYFVQFSEVLHAAF